MRPLTLIIFVFFTLLFSTNSLQSQHKRYFAKGADEAFEDEKYSVAIQRYQKAMSKVKGDKPEKERISFQLAECYRHIADHRKAKAQYKRLIRANYDKKKPLILLYYANILKKNGNYHEAKEYYNAYIEKVPDDPRGLNGAESCDFIQEWIDNPSKYEIEYIKKINSRESDFSPAYASSSLNDLIFTSTRESSTGKGTDEWTDMNFSDLFYTRIDRKGEWSEPTLLTTGEDGINTEDNEGAAILNSKFNTMYFTKCPNVEKKKSGCQIYKSARSGRTWGKPEMVKLSNDSTEAIGHPAISDNELIIYFSSNRPGGVGEKDIWVAFRDDKSEPFSRPFNLGQVINTPGDEMFPFLRNDTVLYFASDGHPGIGGLDIFYTTIDEEGNWGEPVNMRYPLNTSFNDFGISFHPEEEKGFFSSDRRGRKGKEDIFFFIIPPLEFIIQGIVTDDRTLQLVEDAAVTMIGSDGISVSTRTNDKGFYMFGKSQVNPNTTYDLIVSKADYFNSTAKLTTVGVEVGTDFTRDFILKPIPEKHIVLPEILYDLAKWNLKPQYEDSLQGLIQTLDENPRIIIELASHTDLRDSYERNDILSQKRAQSVIDYLILRGIDADRLMAKGYGERQPRALDKDLTRDGFTFKKGIVLTEEYIASLSSVEEQEAAHQMNRRTEFLVLRKDYIPKSKTLTEVGQVIIQINPEDNVVKFRTEPKTGAIIAPCIINGFNDEFYYDVNIKAQISLQKALDLLKEGSISKGDFQGDPAEVLGNNTIKNNAVLIIKDLRIAGKTINDVEVVVSHRLKSPLVFGKTTLQKFGKFTINNNKLEIVFQYD
ncbi:MAG: OmpA family protein [Bacteroidetes bacterium]|nr:OmpA family protein [Bacteroidota bacterium]